MCPASEAHPPCAKRLLRRFQASVVGGECRHFVVRQPACDGLHDLVVAIPGLVGLQHRDELIGRPAYDCRDAFVLSVAPMAGDALAGKILPVGGICGAGMLGQAAGEAPG